MLFTSALLSWCLAGAACAQSVTVDAYLATESLIAKNGLLANIGPSGSKSSGARPGIVVASPSNSNPDYMYTWTRDSALVLKVIIDQYPKFFYASLAFSHSSYFQIYSWSRSDVKIIH